jgi:hypothetical protein
MCWYGAFSYYLNKFTLMVFIVCSNFFSTVATLLAIPEKKQKCIDIESACQLLSLVGLQVEKFLEYMS